jgi:hypothetical protein
MVSTCRGDGDGDGGDGGDDDDDDDDNTSDGDGGGGGDGTRIAQVSRSGLARPPPWRAQRSSAAISRATAFGIGWSSSA